MSSCVHSMDDLYSALLDESGLIDTLIEELLDQKTEVLKTSNLVAITVPFREIYIISAAMCTDVSN